MVKIMYRKFIPMINIKNMIMGNHIIYIRMYSAICE